MAYQPNQPIHDAAATGNLLEVKRLITKDPSLIELGGGQYQHTPFLIAAQAGHAAIVEWLIDHAGANMGAQDIYGNNGLNEGSIYGHLEVVSILLNRGADVNGANTHGCSPLMGAAAFGQFGVVEILLSQDAIDLDVQDADGETALYRASFYGHEQVLRRLLVAGADPRIAKNDGETPLDIAREEGHDGCIQLLEAALAEPERARFLHRARAINDAHHAAKKVARETEGRTRGEKKRKMIAAAPAYLKRRVEGGEELPQVEVLMMHENQEKEKLAAAFERMVMDGQVPSEVFVELMEMMIPKWDDARRRV